jgi:ribosomal protein S18 acetylase RimI-like enzyme
MTTARAANAPQRNVRALGRADVDAAGALLGRAFRDNPVYKAILGRLTDDQRGAVVAGVKRGFADAASRWQQASGVWQDEQLVAVSLVCAPGQYPHSTLAFLRHARGCVPSGPRGIWNFLRVDAYITRRHVREPHFYLFVLGVEPSHQGTGLGKLLLGKLSEQADAADLPCYLETDKPSSVQLYRSMGYEVLTEEEVPGMAGLKMWRMERPTRGT